MKSSKYAILIALIVFALTCTTVFAEELKCSLKAEVIDGKVHLLGTMPDGSPMKGATVEVLHKDGKKLLDGKTDDQGKFSFDLPKDLPGLTFKIQDEKGNSSEAFMCAGKLYDNCAHHKEGKVDKEEKAEHDCPHGH